MRAEGEKWSSSCSFPGKSERRVWAVKASKVKYALCSKFLTCQQLFRQRDLWGMSSSGRSVIQACCNPLQLEPAGARAALVKSQAWCLLPVPPCPMSRPCSWGPRSPSRSHCWQRCLGKARALPNPYIPPLWQCCRQAHRTALRNTIPDSKR